MVAKAQDGAVTVKQTEPTVNGKPYSQYKAEQDALKKQREANKAAAVQNADLVTINPSDAKPAPVKVQPAEKTSAENDGKSLSERDKANVTKAEVKTEPVVIRQQPEGAQIPVRPDFSKNNGANNSNGTTPVEKVKPVNRTTEEAVGNNGTVTPVEASKTKVITPAVTQKNEVATQPALPVGVKLEAGPAEVKVVTEQKAEATQPSGNAPNAAKTKTN